MNAFVIECSVPRMPCIICSTLVLNAAKFTTKSAITNATAVANDYMMSSSSAAQFRLLLLFVLSNLHNQTHYTQVIQYYTLLTLTECNHCKVKRQLNIV